MFMNTIFQTMVHNLGVMGDYIKYKQFEIRKGI